MASDCVWLVYVYIPLDIKNVWVGRRKILYHVLILIIPHCDWMMLFAGYSVPYLTVYAENVAFVYDVMTGEWVQTLPLKRVRFSNTCISHSGCIHIHNV